VVATRLAGTDWVSEGLRRARLALWLRGASSVGQGIELAGRPFIDNRGRLSLGDELFLNSQPVQSHMVVGPGAELSVGSGCRIGYGAAISAYGAVKIGRNVRIGPFVVIMDSDFHVAGDRNAEAAPKPITIGDGAIIESRVTILRGSSIGAGARIRSGSVVSGQIAAGVVAAGVPASAWSEDVGDGASQSVTAVVMKVLSLSAPPQLSDGPSQIAQWDSFGALKLLLALEKSFKVSLREEQIKSAHSIADLADVVEAARRLAGARV
jgi:acetyltransferase-like isoleucine patch superfamily enzyme/acyl carrier protein